jgi:anti-sigma regulatory factor (Ser/Thr protein kinase)
LEDLSLHILDIVENAVSAKAKRIDILVIEEPKEDRFVIEIKDNGIGMDEEASQKAVDPFFTTRTSRRVGLGLSLLAQAAEDAGGTLRIESNLGKGTRVTATFRYHHIDRKPLGNMVETMMALFLGNPELDISYTHKKEGGSYTLSSQWLKEQFQDRSLTNPEVIQRVRKHLQEGLTQIGVQG